MSRGMRFILNETDLCDGLDAMNLRHCFALELRYGMAGKFRHTLKDGGKSLIPPVSAERFRQIVTKAERKLMSFLRQRRSGALSR